MLKKIEALRKEPRHVRNRYAFWTAFCVTLLIIVVWASTLPARFGQTEAPVAHQRESNWGEYKNALGSVLSGAFSRFGAIKTEKDAETPPERIDFVELVASSTNAETTATSTDVQPDLGTTTASTTATSSPTLDATSTATTTEIGD